MFYDVRKRDYITDHMRSPIRRQLQYGFVVRRTSFRHAQSTLPQSSTVLFLDDNSVDLTEWDHMTCVAVFTLCTINSNTLSLPLQADNYDFHQHRPTSLTLGKSFIHSIMTHCYDDSGLRLFAAGGPLTLELVGNYAAIWE